MTDKEYRRAIVDALEGQTDQLRTIPRERLDWAGPGALLALYRKTSGNDRVALVRAIGKVIEDHAVRAPIRAELIQIASSLDLAELEPIVRRLRDKPPAAEEPLRSAIANFLAFRDLDTSSIPRLSVESPNGKVGTRKARTARSAKRRTA